MLPRYCAAAFPLEGAEEGAVELPLLPSDDLFVVEVAHCSVEAGLTDPASVYCVFAWLLARCEEVLFPRKAPFVS